MGEGDYADYSLVKSYKCGCYALFAYNTKRGEFEPPVFHSCDDSVDKVGFERIIHQLKTVAEMKKVEVMGKGGRIKTNNRGRRKEKGVKSVYKVPPKEDKSVVEIMYDLQMAALDEVD